MPATMKAYMKYIYITIISYGRGLYGRTINFYNNIITSWLHKKRNMNRLYYIPVKHREGNQCSYCN